MVKQALKRHKPGISETYHSFRTFGQLLEEAQLKNLSELQLDEKLGDDVIKGIAHES